METNKPPIAEMSFIVLHHGTRGRHPQCLKWNCCIYNEFVKPFTRTSFFDSVKEDVWECQHPHFLHAYSAELPGVIELYALVAAQVRVVRRSYWELASDTRSSWMKRSSSGIQIGPSSISKLGCISSVRLFIRLLSQQYTLLWGVTM